MKYFCLLATLTLAILIFALGDAQDDVEYKFCSVFNALTEVTKEDKQVEAVTTILDDISPEISEALKISLDENIMPERNDSNSSTPATPPLRLAYNILAENFNTRPTATGYSKFVEAVNEISLAQTEACSDPTFVPEADIVQKLAEEFENATSESGRDISKARSIFGKLLCLNTRQEDSEDGLRRKRQSDDKKEKCPCSGDVLTEGLGKVKSVCEFFACLRSIHALDSTLGAVFGFAEATTRDECLAFVIDTTGSMAGAIATAKQVILNFLASEDNVGELQCYILVPFNDYDEKDPDYGPIATVFTKESIGDLESFVANVTALTAHGGGDTPEYALDGMLAALNANAINTESKKVVQLMRAGSQMVVLTDAPSKNLQLEETVIEEANQRGVCVHFFIANSEQLQNEVYVRIAAATSGTIVELDELAFSNFVASYAQNPCDTLTQTRKKRSNSVKTVYRRSAALAPTYSQCKNFYVSSFAYLLKLSIQALSSVTIFRPNGDVAQESVPSGTLVVYSEAMPTDGEWRVCVSTGSLEIAVSQQIALDTSILFINEGSEMPSTSPPPLCTSARIALLSSQAPNISYVSLSLIPTVGTSKSKRINLIKCKSVSLFVSDVITFSKGMYDVQLVGHDIHGVGFSQETGHTLNFDSSNVVNYDLTSVDGEAALEMLRNETTSFAFRLYNPSVYSTTFVIASTSVSGFNKIVTPISVVIPGKESVNITFTISIDSELGNLVKTGSTYRFTMFTSNGCASYSISKRVIVTT